MGIYGFCRPKSLVVVLTLLLMAAAISCGAPQSTATPVPPTSPPASQPTATTAPPAAQSATPTRAAPAFRPPDTPVGATPVPVPTRTQAPAVQGEPKVNRLVIAVDPSAGETNLPWGGTVDHHQQMDLVMEVLIDIDPEANLWVPELAKSWEMSPDGKQWRFVLEEGVQFHNDWGEFTAQDVLHSAAMLTREDSLLGYATDWREIDLETSEIVNDHEVVLHLKNPNPDFPFYVAPSGGGLMMSKAFWDAEGLAGYERDMIGTGPYRYSTRQLGVDVTYERLPDHWRVNSPPPDWPEVDLRWIREPATRNAGLLAGEIHLTELTRELADAAVANHGMKIVQSNFPGNQLWGVFQGLYPETPGDFDPPYMYPDFPPTDIRVREAMNRAIDKDTLMDTLFSGRVTISPVGGFYPNLPGWDPSWLERYDEMYGYDPERARELLAEAGYEPANPLEIKGIIMNIFGFPEAPELMQALEIMFRDVGIEMTLEEWQFSNYFASWTKKQPESVGIWVSPPSYKTVYAQLSVFNRSTGAIHFFETEWLDQKFNELRNTVDLDRRAEIQQEMGEYLFTQYAYMPLFYIFIEFVANPDIIDTWEFPGSDGANYGHFELIRACRTPSPCM